jgi:hypothetical protein
MKFLSNKMAGITTYLSILTVDVNGLNSPIMTPFDNWIKNEDSTILLFIKHPSY